MKYLAILGRQPEIGLLELESLLGPSAIEPFGKQAALLDTQPDITKLGGVIKLGRVIASGQARSIDDIVIEEAWLPTSDTKLTFGVSIYAANIHPRSVQAFGLTLKKKLRTSRSVRLVTGDQAVLSSANIKYNRLLEKGFELIIVKYSDRYVCALTTTVQDVDYYATRDHGRPARSAKVGMLPPKLAQVLLNTAGDGPVHDPFCGTGVVLQEALLMGRPASGSDISPSMVQATTTNLKWLPTITDHPLPQWSVSEADATNVVLPPDVHVVSEGYLGPHLTQPPSPDQLKSLRSELLELYSASLANFARQLAPGQHVSICLPAWRRQYGCDTLNIIDQLPKLGYTLNQFATVDQPIIYARPDQVVARQLLLLTKK